MLFFTSSVLGQISDEQMFVVRPNYKLENQKSEIYFNNVSFFKLIKEDSHFHAYFLAHKNDSYVYFSSLLKFKFRQSKLHCYEINDKYQPNCLLQHFIINHLTFQNFENYVESDLGIFFSYDSETYQLFVEFVEIKDGKFYLITSHTDKVF